MRKNPLFVSLILIVSLAMLLSACGGGAETGSGEAQTQGAANSGSQSDIPALQEELSTSKPGKTFLFGAWDADGKGGPEPIEWAVIARDAGKVLVLSTKILEYMSFQNTPEGEDSRWVHGIWPDCDLRNWLNGEFYDGAFSADEKALILKTAHTTEYVEDYQAVTKDSEENIFLLSYDEEAKYVAKDPLLPYGIPVEKVLEGNHYMAEVKDVPGVTRSMGWWLRSSGDSQTHAMTVPGYSTLYDVIGDDVGGKRGVRPAMWLVYDEALMGAYAAGDMSGLVDEDLTKMLQAAKTGDIITMGQADMNPWAYDGFEDITWRVLDETDDALMLIMQYPCEGGYFMNREYTLPDEEICWATSDARKLLQKEYEEFFSPYEKAKIRLTKVSTCGDELWNRSGGPDTEDYLFLLDAEEYEKYFSTEKLAGWDGSWLRSPNGFAPYFARIGYNGDVSTENPDSFNEIFAVMWVSKK